jgi:hypothetical protein
MSDNVFDKGKSFLALLPPFLPIPRACEVRQCCRSRLYELIGEGRIRAVKDGKSLRVVTESLLADMASLPAANIKPPAKVPTELTTPKPSAAGESRRGRSLKRAEAEASG